MIGDAIDTGTNYKPHGNLLEPPPVIPGKPERYDSVKGHTGGSDIYIVYDNDKTYPSLLVKYMIS